MKIVVILGSPKRVSSSTSLANQFARGASEAGHTVCIFDSVHEVVKPCLACDYCRFHDGTCVQQDAMTGLYGKLLDADVVVFATPLHYFSFSAQIKALISRFHAQNARLKIRKGAVLLVTAAISEDWAFEGLCKTYETMLRYLKWEDYGQILAGGCQSPDMTEKSGYLEMAYELGRNIGKEWSE